MRLAVRAFTLIELLIVVAIIGILAAIAVPNLTQAQVRAKLARVYSEHKVLAGALEAYFTEHGTYPPERADSANDPGGYRYLTSPTPYLTHVMAEPFMRKYVTNRGNDYDTKYEFMVTNRSGSSSITNQTSSGQRNRSIKTTMYNIEGIGPDGIDSFKPTPAYPAHPPEFEFYDASNGLFSYGDILRAGGEYLPRWYREGKGGRNTTGREWQ